MLVCVCVWMQMCRGMQACVFHSVAKLNYPQRCAFHSEKLCTTRQASKGRLGGWMQRQRQTTSREEGEKEEEREIKGGWLLLRKESVVPVWQTSATLLDRG